ncbi:hypothetical protein K469DRAFT_524095, partial [Zopfia rhizophila CBS 207.26]
FAVSKNLYKALKQLRTTSHDIFFWIDAICINQADMDERMHQVELVRFIFKGTEDVLVWLGD